ncbi:hypothetical protein AMTRI_Chr09g12950 [Amborella trichopoda]
MSAIHLRRQALIHVRCLCSSATSSEKPKALTFNYARSRISRTKDLDEVIDIFNSVRELPNVAGSRFVQDIVVHRLISAERFSDIETLLENQKMHPNIKLESFTTSLIICYGKAKMVDRAIKTYQQMDDHGTPRTVTSFNALLTACREAGEFNKVTELFAEIPAKFGLTPTQVSYGILIKSICEMGSPDKAYEILKDMKEKDVKINTVIYTTLIDAFYKNQKPEEARKVWEEMVKMGCSPDRPAYNSRLLYVANHGNLEEALKIIEEMEASELKPDAPTYTFLLSCYCKNGKGEEAKKVYETMVAKACYPTVQTYRIYVNHLCENAKYDLGLEIFMESVKRNRVPPFKTATLLIEGLAKNGKVDEAKELIKTVKNRYAPNMSTSWVKLEAELGLSKSD